MNSFADRADRRHGSNDASNARRDKTDLIPSRVIPPSIASQQEQALQYTLTGDIETSCSLYETIYHTIINREDQHQHRHQAPLWLVDLVTADYCQLLELCCQHELAISILQNIISKYTVLPHLPSLCSILLFKLLFTSPTINSEMWTSLHELMPLFQTKTKTKKYASSLKSSTDHNDDNDVMKEDKTKQLRVMYKSHWSYVTMITELFKREKRLSTHLQLVPPRKSPATDSTTTTTTTTTTTEAKTEPPENSTTVWNESKTTNQQSSTSLFFIGDSHIVTFARRRFLGRVPMTYLTTGLKAWHVGARVNPPTFFTGANFQKSCRQIKKQIQINKNKYENESGGLNGSEAKKRCFDVVISCGEIDCREGFSNAIQKGVYQNDEEAIQTTVHLYVQKLWNIFTQEEEEEEDALKDAKDHDMDLNLDLVCGVYVLPVFPLQKKGRNGQDEKLKRIHRIHLWNKTLEHEIRERNKKHEMCERRDCVCCHGKKRVFVFLKVDEERICKKDESGELSVYLKDELTLDGTHVNAKIIPYVEQAMIQV